MIVVIHAISRNCSLKTKNSRRHPFDTIQGLELLAFDRFITDSAKVDPILPTKMGFWKQGLQPSMGLKGFF